MPKSPDIRAGLGSLADTVKDIAKKKKGEVIGGALGAVTGAGAIVGALGEHLDLDTPRKIVYGAMAALPSALIGVAAAKTAKTTKEIEEVEEDE